MFLLLACQEPEDTAAPTSTEEASPELVVTLDPPAIDFGVVALGAPVSREIVVTNAGTGPITLSGATVDGEDVSIDMSANLLLAPGMSDTVTVTWTPDAPKVLEDTLQVLVSDGTGAFTQVPDPISGTAAGPLMSLSSTSLDFGLVKVGCSGVVPLTITNTGNGDLVISSLTLANDDGLTITERDGEQPVFPWTLVPYGAAQLDLTYTPRDEETYANVLRITSDDPSNPDIDLPLLGESVIEAQNSITFEVDPKENITALFAMNEVVASGSGQFHTRFTDALPLFFDALIEHGAPFRVAFTLQTNGTVQGDIPYIDETYSSAEVVDIVETMAETGMGDNDYLLEALAQGIENNADWLLEESESWEESRLSLIGINSDMEQSTGVWSVFVAEYQAYKEDPEDIVVHAIGGDVPRGCNGAGGFGEPFEPFYNAAAATGGAFLSVCEEDWTTHLTDLAAAVIGSEQVFELTGDPAEWSIEVWIDGAPTTYGWTYDATLHQILFEDDQLPGTEIRVDYILATECADAE